MNLRDKKERQQGPEQHVPGKGHRTHKPPKRDQRGRRWAAEVYSGREPGRLPTGGQRVNEGKWVDPGREATVTSNLSRRALEGQRKEFARYAPSDPSSKRTLAAEGRPPEWDNQTRAPRGIVPSGATVTGRYKLVKTQEHPGGSER